jgi:hypothetical protein
MGQYYRPIIMGKRYGVQGYLYSWDYDNGQKLLEHSYMGNNFVNAVLRKIDHQPMRVAWMGDYADEPYPEDSDQDREPYQRKLPKAQFKQIWRSAYSWIDNGADRKPTARKIHPEPLEGFDSPDRFYGWYLINHSAREYVDLGKFQKENGWVESWTDRDGQKVSYWMAIHPLPLLTACGNDRGGGDYHEKYPDFDLVGIWAFDLIEFANYKPVGFTERVVNFTEQIPF